MSQTGNTKKIAEAIFETISGDKEIKPLNEVESLENYGFTFIGFPIHQMGPPQLASKFIEIKAKNRKIALFVTHASPPGSPFIDPLLAKCKESTNASEMFGIYDCQGVLAQQVADMLLKMDNPQAQQFGKLRNLTVGHPNEQEQENARNFAREMMEKL
ncbi:MAG: flavodoxin [Candidatus Lokiarchaeota archaeon]|nr:flavodoxin [Candidatus Lokiarchaeota archaeon]